jgi:predicted nucleic-acid-binding Zn-ribbon protein
MKHLKRLLTRLKRRSDRFKPLAKGCSKCGVSFATFPPVTATGTLVRYMRDAEFGERLAVTCHRCGFRFFEPTVEQKPR